jgi:uncharacterized protein (DUF1778 family)
MQVAAAIISFRAPVPVLDLIDRAARAQGKTRNDFILDASIESAQRVLLDQVFFEMGAEQMTAFQTATEQPLQKNEAVQSLLSRKSRWGR